MFARLYDRLHNWLERALDRAWYSAMSWFLTWTIPELSRLRSRRDRVLMMVVAGSDRPARRWSRLMIFVGLMLSPVLGVYVGWRLAFLVLPMGQGLSLRAVLMIGGGMLGYLAFGLVIHFATLDRQRRAVYRLLANLDEGICPFCGYDLKGHLAAGADHDVRCPECGHTVPPLADAPEGSQPKT